MDLSSYKWKNRLLLIFAPSAFEGMYKEQLRLLEGLKPEFEERDLLLGEFPEDEAGELNAAKLRDEFNVVPDGFTVLLVGKDGSEKFRSEDPVSAEEIFRRIDAMPMRRREMRG